MRRLLVSIALVGVILVGAWALYHKDEIRSASDAWNLVQSQLRSMGNGPSQFASWSRSRRENIRIASFNIQVFGKEKANRPDIMAMLAKIVREFDIVAVQEIRDSDQTLLARFVEEINRTGQHFKYVISRPVGNASDHKQGRRERYAFLFDAERVELDGAQSYTLNDPDDLLRRDPLVAWFRTRGVEPAEAFTFTLVNVHLDSRAAQRELRHLNQMFRAIRNDGRGEDDVIIMGDFNLASQGLSAASSKTGLSWLISGLPTNTRQTHQYDNIVIDQRATTEFTGRAGVFDFLKKYNLTMQEALEVSDHMPVWAEFTMREGGSPHRVARRSGPFQKTK